jgi:hypothetical protein
VAPSPREAAEGEWIHEDAEEHEQIAQMIERGRQQMK